MFDFLSGMSWIYWLAFIPVLGFLVFIHELGHFWGARAMGVKVEEFGFGYPPRMLTLMERDGVKYTLNWLPLGGFVRMTGEEGNFDAEGSLWSKKPWRRAVVLVAGPLMNLLLAAVLFTVVFATGIPLEEGKVVISEVFPGYPAETAGVQTGDWVVSLNGQPINSTIDLSDGLNTAAGQSVPMVVERGGQRLNLTITPRASGDLRAGIRMDMTDTHKVVRRSNPIESIQLGLRATSVTVVRLIVGLSQTVGRLIVRQPLPPDAGLAGPVGIARATTEVAQQGLSELLVFAAGLSISLGVLNLLPIPALDGGRLLFVFFEWLRGKRIPPEREAYVHVFGMVTLLLLMLVVTYMDVAKWIQGVSPLGGG